MCIKYWVNSQNINWRSKLVSQRRSWEHKIVIMIYDLELVEKRYYFNFSDLKIFKKRTSLLLKCNVFFLINRDESASLTYYYASESARDRDERTYMFAKPFVSIDMQHYLLRNGQVCGRDQVINLYQSANIVLFT